MHATNLVVHLKCMLQDPASTVHDVVHGEGGVSVRRFGILFFLSPPPPPPFPLVVVILML